MNDQLSTDKSSEKNFSDNHAIHVLPYGQDLLEELAAHIIQTHQNHLPDLTNITVLLPSLQPNAHFRKTLLKKAKPLGFDALLGPTVDTLTDWVNKQSSNQIPVLTEHQRELMLVEALVKHPDLYGEGSPWTLADSLLEFFDELTEKHLGLPEDFENFLQQIGDAYQLNNDDKEIDAESLSNEARVVHTLWQAWRQQMQDSGVTDRHTSYISKLNNSLAQIQTNQTLYLAGFSRFTPGEIHWLKTLMTSGQAVVFLQGSEQTSHELDYHPDVVIYKLLDLLGNKSTILSPVDDYGRCLVTIFDCPDTAIKDRAQELSNQHRESPLASRLSLYDARSNEQEALAIDLQTRLWLLEGKRNIGIVTENRRLARRVRALLERANIALQDAAGWALSTTSASATLERWLESVEEDFAYQPLLDLLKSPFFLQGQSTNETQLSSDQSHEDLLATVYRFEQGIILKENISRSLERYRNHIAYRQKRLPEELAAGYNDIYPLLDIIAEAAKPLLRFIHVGRYSPVEILQALEQSLHTLGLFDSLSNDDAGIKILEELQQMQSAAQGTDLNMSWTEFRNWLGRTLERFNFLPNIHTGHVQLMSLKQSALCRFDGLIIAGAEREYLPGTVNQSPFFNDGVRQSLGLYSHTEQLSFRFYDFRRLLESAPNILITRRIEQNNEDILSSPWVERIQSFHTIAYNDDLINIALTRLVGHPDTIVSNRKTPLPQPIRPNPGTAVVPELMPGYISASAYQQLVNCPYQFFAARCLGLEPPETIREMLEKSDYGERVHLCLHAFHSGAKGLPGPFEKPLDKNREEGIQCLISIANAVFARDLEDNFLHRDWLKRWHKLIPSYIDWQIEHQQTWRVKTTEFDTEANLDGLTVKLKGRLDRVDINTSSDEKNLGILDYKTGRFAKEQDILSGESIQLPFYALLARQALQQDASRVEYVSVDGEKVESKTLLEGDTLQGLARQVGQRLVEVMGEIQDGTALIAWGDRKSCHWCQMSGVCRRESWPDS
jgi:ATP-dependent helicase/nuclease subunit B